MRLTRNKHRRNSMKKVIFVFIGLLATVIIFWVINTNTVKSSESNADLILKVSVDKQSYALGEEINLQFEIKDKNSKTFTLRSIPTVEDGYLHVWIASADRNFKEYLGPRWGLSE